MTKTADALSDLLSTLSTYAQITNKLFDTEAGDQAQIAQLTQQCSTLTSQLDSQTAQIASSVDDTTTAASITTAAQTLKDQLKQVSLKAAAVTPPSTSSAGTPVAPPATGTPAST